MSMKLRSIVTFCTVIVLLGLIVFAISISTKLVGRQRSQHLSFETAATLGDTPLFLSFARTQSEWEIGLSRQKVLRVNQGLFFIFKKPDYYGIWMKNMQLPIDVLWLDESSRVVYIKSNFLPSSYPEIVKPPTLSKFVLEVPSGFVEAHRIRIGDKLIFAQK